MPAVLYFCQVQWSARAAPQDAIIRCMARLTESLQGYGARTCVALTAITQALLSTACLACG